MPSPHDILIAKIRVGSVPRMLHLARCGALDQLSCLCQAGTVELFSAFLASYNADERQIILDELCQSCDVPDTERTPPPAPPALPPGVPTSGPQVPSDPSVQNPPIIVTPPPCPPPGQLPPAGSQTGTDRGTEAS